MQISLEGKVAIVTGVSGDGQVGQAVARALAKNGAQLAICARKQSNVEARAKELRDTGARLFAMTGSLTDEGQVQRLIDDTVSEYGRIEVLVNLAGGLSRYKTAVEHSLDDWRAEVDNNLLSAFLTSRALSRICRWTGTVSSSTSHGLACLRPTWSPITARRRELRHSLARSRSREEISVSA
jgi:NAD(P)-dependent dehydrogenase (short-subunit alcohol dehydrogenase family)